MNLRLNTCYFRIFKACFSRENVPVDVDLEKQTQHLDVARRSVKIKPRRKWTEESERKRKVNVKPWQALFQGWQQGG